MLSGFAGDNADAAKLPSGKVAHHHIVKVFHGDKHGLAVYIYVSGLLGAVSCQAFAGKRGPII
jgi:hypothetical protein